jgi:hypothetical protein
MVMRVIMSIMTMVAMMMMMTIATSFEHNNAHKKHGYCRLSI